MPSEISDTFEEETKKILESLRSGETKVFLRNIPDQETATQIYRTFIAPFKGEFNELRANYNNHTLVLSYQKAKPKQQEQPIDRSLVYQMAALRAEEARVNTRIKERIPGVKYGSKKTR